MTKPIKQGSNGSTDLYSWMELDSQIAVGSLSFFFFLSDFSELVSDLGAEE